MSALIGGLIQSRHPDFVCPFMMGNGKEVQLPLANIKFVEAKGSISIFHMAHYQRDQIRVAQTIGQCEEQLENFAFLRIHRKHLVNLSCFQALQADRMLLQCGTSLLIARRRQKAIYDLLKKYQLLL